MSTHNIHFYGEIKKKKISTLQLKNTLSGAVNFVQSIHG